MDLVVADKETFALSLTKPSVAREAIAALRPKSAYGLKRLLQVIDPHGLVDVRNSRDFEIVKPTSKFVSLLPDQRARVGHLDVNALRQIVGALADDEPIPKAIVVGDRPGKEKAITASPASRRAIGRAASFHTPEWLVDLSVYMPAFLFDDIRIGTGSTLEIVGSHVEIYANNFYAGTEARVVQFADHVRLQVAGVMRLGMT